MCHLVGNRRITLVCMSSPAAWREDLKYFSPSSVRSCLQDVSCVYESPQVTELEPISYTRQSSDKHQFCENCHVI